jgi:arylsulfatase A-like enzyme
MIRLPGGRDARQSQAIIQFHDLLPTLLDVLELGRQTTAMQGKSFLPVLRGETDQHREAIITGYYEAPDRCMRDQFWSYIQRPAPAPDELYNLSDDPEERVNLIDKHPQEAQRLASYFGNIYWRGHVKSEVKGIQGKYEMGSAGIE